MAKRTKMPTDTNQRGKAIVDLATGGGRTEAAPPITLGQISGQKGGRERAKRLTPEERSEIARRAARARWDRVRSSG